MLVILTLLLADTYLGAHKVCGQKYPDALRVQLGEVS